MQVKDLIVTGDAKILGNLFTKDGSVGTGGGGGGEGGSSVTYRLSKSGSTITLTGSDGTTSSVTDSDTKTSVDLSGYLPKSGGTMTGALNFANGIWNYLGDDVYFGDNNVAGGFCIKGANGNTNLRMISQDGSTAGSLTWNGSQIVSSANFIAPAFIENGTALSSKYAAASHSHSGYAASNHTHSNYAASNHTHSGYAASSHNHGAGNITAGTFAGQVVANASATATIGTAQVRNIYAGTSDMIAGSSSLATGVLYFVYE